MVMQSVGEEPPLVPFFPELLFGLSFLLVLATVALWLVMVVRNRGRRQEQVSDTTQTLEAGQANSIKSVS